MQKPKLLDQVRDLARLQRKSRRTIDAYIYWIRQFIFFHDKRHPKDMGAEEVGRFLTHLVSNQRVAASTQKQALCAIVFLYKQVLRIDLGDISFLHCKRQPRLPSVLSRSEVWAVLDQLRGDWWVLAALLYGCGLRLMECLRLRVGDIDLARMTITVRAGKGDKDRILPLPQMLASHLSRQVELVGRIHSRDLAAGYGAVSLPGALSRKYPSAPLELRWQWLFPASQLSVDPDGGSRKRYHLHESTLQKQVRNAARRAGLVKRVSPHTLRHTFATHWLEDAEGAQDIVLPRLQRLLGHKKIETTMVYLHLITPAKVGSPLDNRPLAIAI
ncbi:MAG: integron integrase [Desulfobulbaceae bacterium]|nr:integron integrase [Desulfobulbaceae bacterium]